MALVATACGVEGSASTNQGARRIAPAGADDDAALAGSGATFVEPLVREWVRRYRSVAPGVTISYEATSSPPATDRFLAALRGGAGGADFFTSDMPLPEADQAALGGPQEFVYVPWATGAIVAAHNLREVPELRLSSATLAGILSGRITRWDDPAVQADNRGVRLPSQAVTVVYRSDPSGTTSVLSAYLDTVVPGSWSLGQGERLSFPRGQGVRGSEAVAATVARTPGAIGYVQLAHARQAGLNVALLGNYVGRFVGPTPAAVNAAFAGANFRPFSNMVDLLFTPEAPGAYPLVAVNYLMIPRGRAEPAKAAALRHFATWAMSEGQRYAEGLGYLRLPGHFATRSLAAVADL